MPETSLKLSLAARRQVDLRCWRCQQTQAPVAATLVAVVVTVVVLRVVAAAAAPVAAAVMAVLALVWCVVRRGGLVHSCAYATACQSTQLSEKARILH